jgi:hypothetical protein
MAETNESLTSMKQLARYQRKFGRTPAEIQGAIQNVGYFQTIGGALLAHALQVAQGLKRERPVCSLVHWFLPFLSQALSFRLVPRGFPR